ncbi:MAG: hypothetical protein NT008_04155 [Methylococcales bacterium]|nr:hypothetical protein [Methylococcales bacterium]
MKKIIIIIITICMALVSGCSTRITDFTFISSKNIDLSRGADFKRSTVRVKGEDRKSIVIFIPTGVPNVKEALDKAIESTPGAVGLVDGVITHYSWYIPYIYGENWYEVDGTPLIDPVLLKSYK